MAVPEPSRDDDAVRARLIHTGVRVLSVSNFFDTHGGGLERVAGHLSREFIGAGHSATWAASDADGMPDNPATLVGLRCANPTERLTGLPMPLPGPAAIGRLSRAVSDSDAVVIHDALYVTSIVAMLLAKRKRKPVVLIQHIASIEFANPVLRTLMRLANAVVTAPMMAAADRLVFISQTVREDLLGTPPRRASLLLFNGVDHGVFNPVAQETRHAARARWRLPETAPLAIFVGRFVDKKGLSVVRALAARRPAVHFALLGKGPIDPDKWGLANVHVLGQQPQALSPIFIARATCCCCRASARATRWSCRRRWPAACRSSAEKEAPAPIRRRGAG